MATLSKSKKALHQSWRPDFRNTQTLPDTKIIRTGFLLNFVGISLAAICLTMYGIREFTLQNLAKSVNELKLQVEGATSSDRQSLDTNKKFLQSAEIVSEAIGFDAEPIEFHSFLAEAGDTVQDGMHITSVTLNHSGGQPGKSGIPPFNIEIVGKVLENTSVTPAQTLSNFQGSLKGLASLSDKELVIEMLRFNRNNEFGYFDFTLLIKITVEKAPSL
jgi:hypothetical protein